MLQKMDNFWGLTGTQITEPLGNKKEIRKRKKYTHDKKQIG